MATQDADPAATTVGPPDRSAAPLLAGVALTSAGGLAFEIGLTRVFAVTQFYHFAFLTVSVALLGLGASGSALAAFPGLGRGGARRWAHLAALGGVATIGAYAAVNHLPFDSYAIAWDRRQLLFLAAYYLVLAVPFFFGGAVVGAMLQAADAARGLGSSRVYGASLGGSGAGCAVAVVTLDSLGGEAAVLVAAALPFAGAALLAPPPGRNERTATAFAAAVCVALAFAIPAPLEMRLSPYKDLSAVLRHPTAEIVATDWDSGTRIDHVRSDGIRSLPGLSLTTTEMSPLQDGISFDADDLSPIPLVTPADAGFASAMLSALPFTLRPGADALILEPRGGLDVLVALASGASSVTAVEPHRDAVAAVRRRPGNVYDNERVSVVVSEVRTFVGRTDRRFDVVGLALTAPYRPVASGAYSLGEDYRLTVEAFEGYLRLLRPDGVLAVLRWVQTPPSEEIRLIATTAASLRATGHDPAAAIVALRSYRNVLVVVRPGGWSAADLAAIRNWAHDRRFDLMAAPDMRADEGNRYNQIADERYAALAAAVISPDEAGVVSAGSAFDIAPPTDDRPFFGHYFTWAQADDVIDRLGHTWQPFGGAGYLVLLAFLGLAVVAAAILILGPLLLRRDRETERGERLRLWTVGYFSLLGAGFLLVEIPLLQRYILLIGRPATAFAVVLFTILVASGVGSLLSPRVPWRRQAINLVILAVATPFLVTWLTPGLLRLPDGLRLVAGMLLIAPLGVLMGIMFPLGVARLEARAPSLVAWAWGINGTVSVVAAVAAAILALSFGFTVVLLIGAACYAAAALLTRPTQSSRVKGTNETSPRLAPVTSPDASRVNRHSV